MLIFRNANMQLLILISSVKDKNAKGEKRRDLVVGVKVGRPLRK
jgi:hypothetical protein